jgi:hypothetical protein
MNNQTTTQEINIADIKSQYKQLKNKVLFIIDLAEIVQKSPRTIRNHWFAEFWSIPIDYKEVVLEQITKRLSEQKQSIKTVQNAN